jgi:hypothetical protein
MMGLGGESSTAGAGVKANAAISSTDNGVTRDGTQIRRIAIDILCIGCGRQIAEVLATLGSALCHDCRDGIGLLDTSTVLSGPSLLNKRRDEIP